MHSSYSILAPNVIPQGFVDGKVATEKVLGALTLEKDDYRLGNTKVFFKVGVLGTLEDWRDERLARIITLFQAHIRGSILRKALNASDAESLSNPDAPGGSGGKYCSTMVGGGFM